MADLGDFGHGLCRIVTKSEVFGCMDYIVSMTKKAHFEILTIQ